MRRILLISTALFAVCLAGAVGAFAQSYDFEIVSFHAQWRHGTLYAIGEIKNTGALAGSPKVEVIARDKDGLLIDTVDFWPNGISNLNPGVSCGIKYPVTEDPRAERLYIRIVDVSNFN